MDSLAEAGYLSFDDASVTMSRKFSVKQQEETCENDTFNNTRNSGRMASFRLERARSNTCRETYSCVDWAVKANRFRRAQNGAQAKKKKRHEMFDPCETRHL